MSAACVQGVYPPAHDLHTSKLDKPKHIQYWTRCLKTYLPTLYQSNDSNRMMLAFFIISAMDLLDCLQTATSEADRDQYACWVYRCQHPKGGFRGFPCPSSSKLGNELGLEDSGGEGDHGHTYQMWDHATVHSTFFALATLAILGDDLKRVKRKDCLQWLRRVQREDGSFGEHVGEDGQVHGGRDTRFGYTAMGTRWILRGNAIGDVLGVQDVDVEKLVHCIRLAQTYDGGISDSPFHEAHGGYTYCALSALSFLDRLPGREHQSTTYRHKEAGMTDIELTLRWLLSRQTAVLDEEDEMDLYEDDTDTTGACYGAPSSIATDLDPIQHGQSSYIDRTNSDSCLQWVGFNGRCNKIADTCYSWWIGASLAILDAVPLSNVFSSRNYLLEKTQHAIGGFGKKAGDPPDIYHSYLGLAALSILGERGLKEVDPTACFSVDAVQHLKAMPWRMMEEGNSSRGVKKRR